MDHPVFPSFFLLELKMQKKKNQGAPEFEPGTSHSAVECSLINNVNESHYSYFLITCGHQPCIRGVRHQKIIQPPPIFLCFWPPPPPSQFTSAAADFYLGSEGQRRTKKKKIAPFLPFFLFFFFFFFNLPSSCTWKPAFQSSPKELKIGKKKKEKKRKKG